MMNMDNESAIQKWRLASEQYSRVADDEFGWKFLILPYVMSNLDVFENAKFLDAGCGNGRLVDVVKNKVSHLTLLDWCKEIVDIAAKRFPNAKTIIGDVNSLNNIINPIFDVISSINVLQNHENYIDSLLGMHKALRENGRILVIIEHPNRTSQTRRAIEVERFHAPRAYNAEFCYISTFLGDEFPIIGWHRPLKKYISAFIDTGFKILSFDELSIEETDLHLIDSEAVPPSMLGEPVFAAFILGK
jgi:ubiquinone/menaquinone biosynthesis C-methylase UbiE